MTRGLTKENLLRTFPVALRNDAPLAALGESTAALLASRVAELDRLRLYANTGALPEELLDILARDFKVDWWDADYSLEEKRRTLQSSWLVHKRLGTKAAVDEALSAIYPGSSAKPWFAYGGEPYHFRLEINAGNTVTDLEKQARVLRLARAYQSLRDRLDEIRYTVETKAPAALRLGGFFGTAVTMPIPEAADTFDFRSETRTGGAFGALASLSVPESQEE